MSPRPPPLCPGELRRRGGSSGRRKQGTSKRTPKGAGRGRRKRKPPTQRGSPGRKQAEDADVIGAALVPMSVRLEVEKLLVRALDVRLARLEPMHPDVATSQVRRQLACFVLRGTLSP